MGERADDIEWFTPEGTTMTEDDWQVSYARSKPLFVNGEAIRGLGNRGQRVVDESFYAVFNAFQDPIEFILPDGPYAERWVTVIDTAEDDVDGAFPAEGHVVDAKDRLTVQGRSVVVLRAVGPVE
jgi:glycogen operon protein